MEGERRMIRYRDMTFCTYYKDCKKKDTCHRPLTPEVIKAAKEFGLPCEYWGNKPECHDKE